METKYFEELLLPWLSNTITASASLSLPVEAIGIHAFFFFLIQAFLEIKKIYIEGSAGNVYSASLGIQHRFKAVGEQVPNA